MSEHLPLRYFTCERCRKPITFGYQAAWAVADPINGPAGTETHIVCPRCVATFIRDHFEKIEAAELLLATAIKELNPEE